MANKRGKYNQRQNMADFYDLCSLKGGIDEVCCSTASSDNHPPSNLIQSDGNTNSCEFLADHFIKPPVFLYFHVPARIAASLVQITADTNVGEQISSTIEISGCDKDITCCQRCSRKEKNERMNIEQHDYRTNNLFTFLGKREAEDNHVSFTNTKLLRENNTYRIKDTTETQNVIKNIRIICIGIKRTKNASIPCLKNLKILVKPNDSESRKYLDECKQASYSTTTLNFFGGGGVVSEPVKSIIEPEQNTIFQQQIPDEFLDELTQEIMQIPMVLPSGKIVDRSTVDKCNASQAVYGGLPRDPFSGRVYTSSLKPVFNASLKSRIDEFVTENRIEIHSGQTVGNARSIQEFLQNKHNPRKRKFLEDM